MSVCSLTEVSVQADSLITPLHHTTLLSYCRFSTDEGFLCVCVFVCKERMTKCTSFVQLNLCIYTFAHAWSICLCHFSGSTSFLSGVNRKHYMSCVQETLCVRVCVSRLYMHVYISVTSLSAFAISPSHSHSFNQV